MVRGSRRNNGRPDQERSPCGGKLPSRRALTRGSLPPTLGIHRRLPGGSPLRGPTAAAGSVTELSANQVPTTRSWTKSAADQILGPPSLSDGGHAAILGENGLRKIDGCLKS
jgi:hypothetical protein